MFEQAVIKQAILKAAKQRMPQLKYHPIQWDLIHSQKRFNIVSAGRRSGKTEIVGKRRLVKRAVRGVPCQNPRYFVAAPTHSQAKKIYWRDLKLISRPFWAKQPSESELIIYLVGDREIHVFGLDKPERAEGMHWDGGVLDEYGNMKPNAWPEHIRPALFTPGRPPGWCDFIGVPEGRNHYYDLVIAAENSPDWDAFTWHSADILPAEEIEQARRELDELTFQQEYEGSFINFSGRAYYNFDRSVHVRPVKYDERYDLYFALDFNVNPGVAAIIQEMPIDGETKTCIIGEVHIPKNSNTVIVSNRLAADWQNHQGKVILHGDATGGLPGSAKIMGSDWDLVIKVLRPVFGSRLINRVQISNPKERQRVNAVNSRLRSTDGATHLLVDPSCKQTIRDFDGVAVVEGGSGEIDKKRDLKLTHLTDAIGYHIHRLYPINKQDSSIIPIVGI